MDFVTISVKCRPDLSDALIAEFFEIGFDSFQEFDDGFEASSEAKAFSEISVQKVIQRYEGVSFTIKEVEKVNWNEEWEKNYDPILVDGKCMVRATFHEADPSAEYDILVNPKMSFGTGHHATTYLMLSHQMKLDHIGKKVLDVGCGTGILSIMAALRGASKVIATDIDDWSIENSKENFSLNQLHNIQLVKGQIDVVDDKNFDIIIANINKNVLIDQIERYASMMVEGGHLLLSGFYQSDIPDLVRAAEKHQLVPLDENEKEKWSMLALVKPKA